MIAVRSSFQAAVCSTNVQLALVTQRADAKASRRGPAGGDSIDELLNTVGIQYTQ